MIEVAVVSGKGGTGKTSLTASFAVLAEQPVVADCDVDAADLHLVLQPTVETTEDFSGRSLPEFFADLCTRCGDCIEVCRFEALSWPPAAGGAGTGGASPPEGEEPSRVDTFTCAGCGLCARVCPSGAIAMEPAVNGELYTSRTRVGPMAHARLGIAEDASGKLVTKVRERARQLAERSGRELVLIDGPPGIGCPVIASIAGVDLLVIVTEPTVAGRHDLERVVRLAEHFRRRIAVCINKWDLNEALADRLTEEAWAAGAVVVGRVRYDGAVTAAQRAGRSLVEHATDGAAADVRAFWDAVVGAWAAPAPARPAPGTETFGAPAPGATTSGGRADDDQTAEGRA
jgi:MinD superfamily P-loop ATPase